MVILLPDGGRGYLGKVFNDKWMRSYGFLPASEDRTVADIIGSKDGSMPELVHAHPGDTVREVMDILKEYDISQVPVLSAEPPVVMGEVVGSLDERGLLEQVFTGGAQLTDSVAGLVGPRFPLIGMHESVEEARQALSTADALLVTNDGKPAAVLTRHDLLSFLSS
jgi:cystathionine beta-synthase